MAFAYSEEEKLTLYQGASVSVLGELFGMDVRDITKKLAKLKPSGERNGWPVYALGEAARYLVDPVIDVEEYIKKLKPSDLPTALQDAYWKGQLSRQKWEENAKHLWRTEAVMSVFTEAFKNLRQTILLFSDAVEAKDGLTEEQRATIESMADGLLDDLRRSLLEKFELHVEPDERADA
jgi:hypothetical protein